MALIIKSSISSKMKGKVTKLNILETKILRIK